MNCTNRKNVQSWFDTLSTEDVSVRRYTAVPIKKIPRADPNKEMIRHVDEWLSTGNFDNFWHIKQLIMHFKNQQSKIPIVVTRLFDHMFVDPGNSRLTVLEFLGKEHVDVDVVYPNKHFKDTEVLGDYIEINDVTQLISPYEQTGIPYRLDTCYASPCKTCIENKVIHNGNYRYSPEWQKKWFYEQRFEEWHATNSQLVVENKMDYYHL